MEHLNWAVAHNVPVLIFEYDGFGATDPRLTGIFTGHETTAGAISSGFDVITSSDIVGSLNQNPPIYPNDTWDFKNDKFEIFPYLSSIF